AESGVKKTPLNAEATADGGSKGFEGNGAGGGGGGGAGRGEDEESTAATAAESAADGGTAAPSASASASDSAAPAAADDARAAAAPSVPSPASPLADFITQTDKYGNATTPRTAEGIDAARRMHPSGPRPHLRVEGGVLVEGESARGADGEGTRAEGGQAATATAAGGEVKGDAPDACDTLLDSFRMMCCCLLPEDPDAAAAADNAASGGGATGEAAKDSPTPTSTSSSSSSPENKHASTPSHPVGYSTRGHDAPLLLEEHSALRNGNDPHRIKLLPELHRDDRGKKCLVLDLDETLVHSSFRAVPGADFVIPVQIEDVVHFVYVAKRPGVDEFLLEMSRHYEIVVYTASLNKYADVLLDLLDPHRVVRTRLFRESCVFYEGNYVKDLSLLNRDLSQAIIIDNSPASYLFHPENAIDCSSFIDDVSDRELDHIGKFLAGVKDVDDVRGTANLWRHWPNVDLTKNHRRIR
ncbi:hypothetical protein ACHAWF_007353, partial [Thalassiosira exigua]